MSEGGEPTADETNGSSAERTHVRDRLKLLFGLTCCALIVGIVGLAAVTELVGYRDARTRLFFIPVIPGITGLAIALLVRKYKSGGDTFAIRFAAAMTTVMAMFTGCASALALAALLLFVLFTAAICTSGVQ